MQIFIALLPLFVFGAVIVGLVWLIYDSPPYLWLTYHLIVLEVLWICQLTTDKLTDNVFHFLFAASVYCGLAIVICGRRFLRHIHA